METLAGYYNTITNQMAFTTKGRQWLGGKKNEVWVVRGRIDGAVLPEYEYLVTDTQSRSLEIDLANALPDTVTSGAPETALTGEELNRQATRSFEVGPCALSEALPSVLAAYQDLIAGYSAYRTIDLKIYRRGRRQRKRK